MNLIAYLLRSIRAGLDYREAASRAVQMGLARTTSEATTFANRARQSIDAASYMRQEPDAYVPFHQVPIDPDLAKGTIDYRVTAVWEQGGHVHSYEFSYVSSELQTLTDLEQALASELEQFSDEHHEYGDFDPESVQFIPTSVFRGRR